MFLTIEKMIPICGCLKRQILKNATNKSSKFIISTELLPLWRGLGGGFRYFIRFLKTCRMF